MIGITSRLKVGVATSGAAASSAVAEMSERKRRLAKDPLRDGISIL
jgi:hypothetical protein